jgi:hypothetical protein
MAKTRHLSPLPLSEGRGESPQSRYLLPSAKAFAATSHDYRAPKIVFVICILAVASRRSRGNFLQNGFRFGYPQIDWAGNAPGYGVCHAERMQTIVLGRFTRSLRLSRSSDRAVYAGRAASLLFLEQAFNPRNTQMNANRKELVLDFAKLSGCDTSSYRFGCNAALDEKRCEDAPHPKSTSCKSLFRFVSIRVVRGQQNFSKAV